MVCIYCGKNTLVVNSRYKKSQNNVWRRRKCGHCGALFTTFEEYDLNSSLAVIKRSGGLEGFDRDKLLLSIAKAIDHKSSSPGAAGHITQTVIRKLLNNKVLLQKLSTKDISNMTSLVLKRYDAASSIRYLSYQSPTQGKRDINKMLK